jgi:Uncharacterized conserved protein related to dihydrodipicolinate reductase
MGKKVVVWGTGNVGRPAIRSVAANKDLDLAGVLVQNPDKVGKDAGDLAGMKAQVLQLLMTFLSLLRAILMRLSIR